MQLKKKKKKSLSTWKNKPLWKDQQSQTVDFVDQIEAQTKSWVAG